MRTITLFLLLMSVNPLFAADVVDRIFETAEMQAEFEAQFVPLADAIFRDDHNANSENAEIRKLRKQVIEKQEQLFRESFSWESAKSDLKALYFEVYTQEELEAYSRFIQTDAGKSFVDKSEQIVLLYRTMVEKRAARFVDKKQAVFKEYRKQIRQYEESQ